MNSVRQGTLFRSVLALLAGGALLSADEHGLLRKSELKALIGSAKTTQDHERLAQHFDAKADQLEAEAKEH